MSGRVLRGGSWSYNVGVCRSAIRFDDRPDYRCYVVGFRIFRSVPFSKVWCSMSKSGIKSMLIPGGNFLMGSNDGWDDERPVHRVHVDAFLLGETPVTNAQYAKFIEDAGHRKPSRWGDANFNQPDMPVVGVSWDDASAFCEWDGGRLPTEAEWEYACRAGTTGKYHCPDSELGDYAWYSENSEGKLHPVRQKQPNAFGLYDMHGLVWEWCEDIYKPYEADETEESVEDLRAQVQQLQGTIQEMIKIAGGGR